MALSTIKPLLTIAIPTYNRDNFLDRCLSCILEQLDDNSLVEVIVSDNASTDSTNNIVMSYKQIYPNIIYICNETNLGFDGNFRQCFNKAKGKYLLCIGDDDILLPGAVKFILAILSAHEVGVVHLSGTGFVNSPNEIIEEIKNVKLDIYKSSAAYLSKVHYNITFISGNIVNLKYFSDSYFEKFSGTNLAHTAVILKAIIEEPINILVSSKILGIQIENTGGYKVFRTFGPNFVSIIEFMIRSNKIRTTIINELILGFFPKWIVSIKNGNNRFLYEENPQRILAICFKEYQLYRIIAPLFHFSRKQAKLYLLFIRIFNKLRKDIFSLKYRHKYFTTVVYDESNI
jgi:glycosyltransferase involved in cell wall biosynthesis